MNKRLIGVVASVLLAGIGTFILINYVRGAESRALEGQESVQVLVASRLIEKGTPAAALQASVRAELIPAKVEAAGAVASLTDLEGLVASVDLLPGEQIVSSRFQDPEALAIQDERAIEVPEDLLEVTVAVDAERALGGELRPGDTVAVLSSFEPFTLDAVEPSDGELYDPSFILPSGDGEGGGSRSAKTPNTTHIILRRVLVTAVQEEMRGGGSGSLGSADSEDAEVARDPAPQGELLVTLAVDAPAIERIVFTAEHGLVYLAKDGEGTPLNAPIRIQTRGTIYQ